MSLGAGGRALWLASMLAVVLFGGLATLGCVSFDGFEPDGQPSGDGVQLIGLVPSAGPPTTEVAITGRGLSIDANLITFGPTNGLKHLDGTPANVVARSGAQDGILTFTVPATGPSGILCNDDGRCIGVTASRLSPGDYDVVALNASGASNSLSFTLTGEFQ